MRVLQDQYYPVKLDNTNRIVVLDEAGNIRPEAVKELSKENKINIAKIVWLSRKDSPKLYGSIVLYDG